MTKTEEAIAELKNTVAILNSRIDRAERDLQQLGLDAIRDRLTRIETTIDHLEQGRKEHSGRNVVIGAAIISAILGSAAGALASYFLKQLSQS